MSKTIFLLPSYVNVAELERIKSKIIVPINETDESDWEIPSFMNKEKQNEITISKKENGCCL